MTPLLEVADLETAYGASQVLFGISFDIQAGEVATLLGHNGMGKTTTVRSLLGLARSRAGSVRFRGERIDTLRPDRIARMGLAVVPEGRQIFPNLSVQEKLLAIGRALMTNPHLLILDEATEGLAPLVREEIWRCLNALRDQGQTILVIDKYVQRLVALANRHTLIERGRVVWQGNSAQLAADPGLWHRYIGI